MEFVYDNLVKYACIISKLGNIPLYAPHAVHLDLYPSFVNVHWGHFHVSVTKKRSYQDFLYYENYIFHSIYVTNNILHTGLFSSSVISPLYTYKQFGFVLNLPRHSCAYREIIRDN